MGWVFLGVNSPPGEGRRSRNLGSAQRAGWVSLNNIIMKIFCIIPALNEEKYIGQVVANVKPLVDEVVVVDDGSTDKTAELARSVGATVLSHLLNSGQGASLETGNQYALSKGADIIFHFEIERW